MLVLWLKLTEKQFDVYLWAGHLIVWMHNSRVVVAITVAIVTVVIGRTTGPTWKERKQELPSHSHFCWLQRWSRWKIISSFAIWQSYQIKSVCFFGTMLWPLCQLFIWFLNHTVSPAIQQRRSLIISNWYPASHASIADLPELETELVVEVEWEWSIAGEVDVDELVLVPSSVVFLKKLCCRA